jgi:hypothetical protein
VPRLAAPAQLEQVAAELAAHPARLVILDPLYLAAAGARGNDLYEMGELLQGAQQVCQHAGAALVVVAHWNKTGEGRGHKRTYGTGPAQWGRVLVSASVHARHTGDDLVSTVELGFEAIGGEIADQQWRIRRTVWADDPADLASPLHYQVDRLPPAEPGPANTSAPRARFDGDPVADQPELAAVAPAARKLLLLLRQAGQPLTLAELLDRAAGRWRPMDRATASTALNQLAKHDLADGEDGAGAGKRWWSR